MIDIDQADLTSIHSPIEKLNRSYRHRLPLCLCKAVPLIMCFRGINGINLLLSVTSAQMGFTEQAYTNPRYHTTQAARDSYR